MVDARGLRRKDPVTYAISDDSDDDSDHGPASPGFNSPVKRGRNAVDAREDDDSESDETADELIVVQRRKTPPPRTSAAGHSLRQPKDLYLSTRALENADKPRVKRQKVSKKTKRNRTKAAAEKKAPPLIGPRREVREAINTETAGRRARFFIDKAEYFLPLLPESNHVKKLVEQLSSTDFPTITEYEAIEKQPAGVEATMKPYQLGGLSFLLYLQRNGLSGILGDEMGLGKTLQTLSLIQYLKENRDMSKEAEEKRPCLVVCPMSVLSSWISEARRWTPGLKVLRFHGPVHERNRLKRVATGEEDMYGNDTQQAKVKKNKRLAAKGKEVINLDMESDPEQAAGFDLVVTTYETFTAEQSWFKRAFVWRYCILDEGHKIKNDLSQISTALQGLGAEYRLILTGTPLQNNMLELWALLHWLYPEVFTEKTSELFKASFDLHHGKVNTEVMDNARRLLELIMLRRMKNSPGVDLNLPPKTDVLLFVPLTPMQRFWYTRLLSRTDKGLLEELFQDAKNKEAKSLKEESENVKDWQKKDLEELEKLEEEGASAGADWEESKEILRQALASEKADETKNSAWRKLMNLLMQLRKCCNHPYILPNAAPDPYYLGEHIINASAKFILLEKIVQELVVKQKKKILIFSGFTRMLDCCEDLLNMRGGNGEKFKYCRLDGGTGRTRRNLGIRLFNKSDSEYRVMLISMRAGGLGINLATASDVVILDQDWNPQIMLQAESRSHRIGQLNPVTIYKLCTQGTVEEQMMGRIQKKLYLSAKVTESMRDIHSESHLKKKRITESTEDMPQLGTTELMSLVRRGAQALSHPELDVNEMLNWDWETTLEKCKDKPSDIHISEDTKAGTEVKEEDEKAWLAQMEQVESRIFQGRKFAKAKIADSFGDIGDATREDRRIGKNTTVMVDGFAVSKESMLCEQWTAVPTLAGKDPRLAEPVREKKRVIVNQEMCQVCWEDGSLVLCSGCPRSYHVNCLDKDFQTLAKGKMHFHCPQHQCADCLQKTGDAGGMIYRCRWCERGYCEDCLDWDKTELLGENLKEYKVLGFPSITQAFYISCQNCADNHEENPQNVEFCEKMDAEFSFKYDEMIQGREKQAAMEAEEVAQRADSSPTMAESLTDATTLDDSGVSTPKLEDEVLFSNSGRRKRKSAPASFMSSPAKKSKRITLHFPNSRYSLSAFDDVS